MASLLHLSQLTESQGATLNADGMGHFKERGVTGGGGGGGSRERASNKTRSVCIDVFA